MLHTIRTEQFLPTDRERLWQFMSEPANLAEITPAYMRFTVLSKDRAPIYAGQIVEYHVRPVAGIRLHWVTEITHVKEGVYFVDEQRFGPYAFWHHQHHLLDAPGGMLMRDIVHYKVPLGPLGRLANRLFVHRQLQQIFNYRASTLEKIFDSKKPS